MLRKIAFAVLNSYYKLFVKEIGHGCMLHGGGRAINGSYVHLKDEIELGANWLMAVYPEYGGMRSPVAAEKGRGIHLGNHVTANRNLTIYCAEDITIEDNVMMGSSILITDNDHGTDGNGPEYWKQPLKTEPVLIHKGCWICERACILKGTEIGERSVVAANSVVKGKFPAYSMIAGSPAKVVRQWNRKTQLWEKV